MIQNRGKDMLIQLDKEYFFNQRQTGKIARNWKAAESEQHRTNRLSKIMGDKVCFPCTKNVKSRHLDRSHALPVLHFLISSAPLLASVVLRKPTKRSLPEAINFFFRPA